MVTILLSRREAELEARCILLQALGVELGVGFERVHLSPA